MLRQRNALDHLMGDINGAVMAPMWNSILFPNLEEHDVQEVSKCILQFSPLDFFLLSIIHTYDQDIQEFQNACPFDASIFDGDAFRPNEQQLRAIDFATIPLDGSFPFCKRLSF